MTRDTLSSLRGSRLVLISLFMIIALLGLGTALFSDGFHYGLYLDDWTLKLSAYNLENGQWNPRLDLPLPYVRPVGQVLAINLANALPNHELPVRLLWAAVHLGNVCLAAFFAYRLAKSPLVLVTAGAVLLFPLPAHEAIFWHSAAAFALLGTGVALLSMHLLLSSVNTERGWRAYAILGLAVFALIPQFYEQAVLCVLILPLLTLIEKPFSRKRLRRALLILLVAAGLLLLHWFFILRHNQYLAGRGGVVTSLPSLWSERLPSVLQGIAWRVFGLYGLSGYRSAWALGMQRALGSPVIVSLVALLAVGAALVVFLASRQNRAPSTDVRRCLVLLAAGLLWTASAFVPVLIFKGQTVESRLLYYPWVGLAFVCSAGIALLMPTARRRGSYALALLLGLFFVAELPAMAGFGQVYKLRYEHDQKQLVALAAAAPRLPEGEVMLVPVQMDEGFVSTVGPDHEILELSLLGVFEADWSAASSASLMYRKPDIRAVASSRWRDLSLQGTEGEGVDIQLVINGQSIPAARSLFFRYEDGQVVLYDHVMIGLPSGHKARIELPLASQVGAPGPTIAGTSLGMEIEGPSTPETATTETFGDLISLTSYALMGYQLPGLDLHEYALFTRWSCQDPIPADYTLYVHYVDGSGDLLAQDDHVLGRYSADDTVPTSQWPCPGSYLDVSYVPGDLVEEEGIDAAIGLWIPETGGRLEPSGTLPTDPSGRVRLGIED